ncbi:HAD family acid phosphatase [Leifsonia sp. fls2-241-R2A-40a]|uniref:phosphatase domain-containing protein n=1 Tax=Leifsonia sp. fls2-241-R2A-40a TaxID=3040290 RepID=UPI0025500A71|nr:HAD family acid phosphatase [Leifsonia sp. fls2-241-R2A-40a]
MPYTTHQAPRPAAIVCDIDGTLCDVRSIRYLVELPSHRSTRNRDYNAFHSQSINCPAFPEVVGLLDEARRRGRAILLATGREEKWAFLTSLWLKERGVEYDELLMRPRNDFRADVDIKASIAEDVTSRYQIELAVDDRPEIIEVWKATRFPTRIVDPDGHLGDLVMP